MQGSRLWACIILSFFLSMLVSCGDGGSSPSGGGGGTGTVSLSLTDATINEVQAVYVTIAEVSVHKDEGSGWEVIAAPNQTYNLLELVNGVREDLGIAELETGHYTQLRMKLIDQPDDGINILSEHHPHGNYVIDDSPEPYTELKIPSGFQTGIKVVCGFDINLNETTELLLDFDASRSIVETGSSENLLLKPTVKVLELREYSIITGTVQEGETGPVLPGVLVSAQIFDPRTDIDPKDRAIVQASTRTDASGSYAIFLEPGTYSIVAYMDAYLPECAEIMADSDMSYTQSFQLSTATNTQNLSGRVTIAGGTDDQHATISFRQSTTCDLSPHEREIELKSVNVIKDGIYSEPLPEGSYTVVASTYNRETIVASPTITAGADTVQDFDF